MTSREPTDQLSRLVRSSAILASVMAVILVASLFYPVRSDPDGVVPAVRAGAATMVVSGLAGVLLGALVWRRRRAAAGETADLGRNAERIRAELTSHQLGGPAHVYRSTFDHSHIVIGEAWIGGAVAGVTLVALHQDGWGLGGGLVLAVVGGGYAIVRLAVSLRALLGERRVVVAEDGVVVCGKGPVFAAVWGDLEFLGAPPGAAERAGWENFSVRTPHGDSPLFKSADWTNFAEFREQVRVATATAALAHVVPAFEAGQEVLFGDLALSQKGVRHFGRSLSYDEIRTVARDNDFLQILPTNPSEPPLQYPWTDFPNASVALSLLDWGLKR